MNKPAVMEGCYVDLKFLPGLKTARVFVDIPIEYSNLFLKMFDAPDRANPVRVALARLEPAEHLSGVSRPTTPGPDNASPSVTAPSAESQRQETRRNFRDLPRSQQAALKCQDTEFQNWLQYGYEDRLCKKWFDTKAGQIIDEGGTPTGAVVTDLVLKDVLGIDSKKQLDTSPVLGAAWDKLLASYDFKDQVR